MDQYKEKLKLGVRNLRMIFAKRKIRELEQEIQLLQGSIEMFQIERDQSFQLMDELRLALQASVLEKKQMREALEFYGDINNFRTFDSPAVKDYGKKARQALGLVVGS